MKFLLDENFPKLAQQLLRSCGHEVLDVRGSPCEGNDDASVFALAQDNAAILLTTDRVFYHTVPHLYPHHNGVVVVALRQPNRRNILKRLEWFLKHLVSSDIRNRVFELRDRTYVVYTSCDEHDS